MGLLVVDRIICMPVRLLLPHATCRQGAMDPRGQWVGHGGTTVAVEGVGPASSEVCLQACSFVQVLERFFTLFLPFFYHTLCCSLQLLGEWALELSGLAAGLIGVWLLRWLMAHARKEGKQASRVNVMSHV